MPSPIRIQWNLSGLSGARPSQQARLQQLPDGTDAPEQVVERINAHEDINTLFAFSINTLCTNASFAPVSLIDQEVTLQLQQADGNFRV